MAARWREKAWVRETFDRDIDEALARLAVPRTKLHRSYVIDTAKQLVIVLQVWSQLRERPPRL